MFNTTYSIAETAEVTVLQAAEQTRRKVVSALRLTVAAMLFVISSFLSLGASATTAVAKTAAKGKNIKVVRHSTKQQLKRATARKQARTQLATKAKRVKATGAKAKKALALKARNSRSRIARATLRAKRTATTAAKRTAAKLGGNFALLNQYRQDLARYGAKKLEGWQKVMEGESSWYGTFFHGRLTASGRRFNKHAHIAAHRSLPFGTVLRVTNLANGKSEIVEVLDRGPYVHDRLIDLSEGTARALDFFKTGTARVRTEILKVGDLDYKIEAPLTAAELRGDINRHKIDLAALGIDATDTKPEMASLLEGRTMEVRMPTLRVDSDATRTIAQMASDDYLYALRRTVSQATAA